MRSRPTRKRSRKKQPRSPKRSARRKSTRAGGDNYARSSSFDYRNGNARVGRRPNADAHRCPGDDSGDSSESGRGGCHGGGDGDDPESVARDKVGERRDPEATDGDARKAGRDRKSRERASDLLEARLVSLAFASPATFCSSVLPCGRAWPY